MSSHHPYGPSSLARVIACPGSVYMCQQCASEGGSAAADEGTMLHAVVAGATPPLELTAEQAEAVQACREELARFDAPQGVLQEQRLALLDDDFNELSFGTADAVIVREDDVVIVDWKFGRNRVEQAESNWQLKAYAAMAMQTYGKERVQVVVFQPRIPAGRTDAVFAGNVLAEVQAAIQQAMDANAAGLTLRYSEAACKYCAAKTECPEFNRKAMAVVCQSTQAVTDPRIIADWLEKAGAAAKWAENVKHRARQMMIEEKLEVPGWGLANRQGKRIVKDAQALYQKIQPVIGHEAFMALVDVKMGEIEDVYARKRKEVAGISLVAAKRELAELLEGAVERQPDSLELRRKSSKGE